MNYNYDPNDYPPDGGGRFVFLRKRVASRRSRVDQKSMFRFEELDIWNLSIDYCLDIYKLTHNFPQYEQYALSNQLRRSSSSISTNIAEGTGTNTPKDLARYLGYATASATETISLLTLANKLGYIDQQILDELYEFAETIIRKTRRFKKTLYS